jgi:hypothetical protein
MPKKSPDHSVDILNPMVHIFDSSSKQFEENKASQDAFKEISKEISRFLTLSDISYGPNTITRCRNLLQKVIVTMLKFYGETPSDSDHLVNQKNLSKCIPGESTLFAYIDIIRIAGNTHCTLTKTREDHETIGILNLCYHCIEKFHDILSSSGEKELLIFRSLELEDENILKRVPLFEKPKFEYKKLQYKDDRLKENQQPVSFLAIVKESPKSSPKTSPSESPRDDEAPKMVGQDEKGTPCMENACGLDCQFSGCPRTHGRRDLVYWPLTKIGTKLCCRGQKCEKNSKVLVMKNGWSVSICPDLHKDQMDVHKAELGKRWKLFAEGKISYDGIFAK